MPSIRRPESLGALTKTSSSTVSLAASRVNIGGQQYVTTSPLTLNTAVVGAGGVDAALQANKLYYVYAVIASGAMALIGSTNASFPSGYTSAKIVGYFDANSTPQIQAAASTLTGAVGDVKASMLTEAQFQAENGPGWVLADSRSISGSRLHALGGFTTALEARGRVLRGKDHGLGVNPDGNLSLGAVQDDATKRPNTAFTTDNPGNHTHRDQQSLLMPLQRASGTSNDYIPIEGDTGGAGAHTHSITGGGDNETRMKNVTVNFFVKIN